MKATLSLFAVILGFELTSSVLGQQINCANIPPPGPKVCLANRDVCTYNVTGCCDGLTCAGFTFFKRCVTPPVCQEEWHDCATPDGYSMKCCPPFVCAQTPAGNWACQNDDIGVKKCPIPGSYLKTTPAPTPAPAPAKNLNTTTIPGAKVTLGTSCCVGDPHCYTFDGLKFDCQSEGEHVLLKSKTTQRQINGLYKHYASNVAISVTKGVVIQDEGATPRVQIYIPDLKSTPANLIDKTDNCSVLLFIDGVQKNLFDPTLANGTSVKILISGTTITVLYPVSQFYVTVGVSYWNTCLLAVCAYVPNVDHVYGIMGTNNGNTSDDWTLPNGTQLPVPTTYVNRLMQPGFYFCNNYCVRNQSDSLFIYPENGCDFTYFDHCALPYGTTLNQILANLSQAIINVCGDDVDCLMDGMVGGLAAAQDLMQKRLPIQGTCNKAGGECSTASCCTGLTCIDTGMNGKFCGTPPTCSVELADCSSTSCCANLTCVTNSLGKKYCESNQCGAEWINCNTDDDCCDKLNCVDNLKGAKQCRLLPTCMSVLDECSQVGCCGDLQCVGIVGGSRQCQSNPVCLNTEWAICDTIPCCEGLTCIVDDDNRNVCASLPDCEDVGGSCEYVGCCNDDQNVFCADVVDDKGRAGKQCMLSPVDLTIRLYDDCNANGQYDVGENGLTALAVHLVTAEYGTQLTDQGDGGTAHLELRTDTNGLVTFTKVPRGLSLAAYVVYPPNGAIPTTYQKAGVDDDICSHLKSTQLSDVFNFDSSTDVQTTKSLGYITPGSVSVAIFVDGNGNGILDSTDKTLPGTTVRLTRVADGQPLPDQQNGGCAGTLIPVDASGRVTFTKVPQGLDLTFTVTNPPTGALVTVTPAKFNLQGGACAVFNTSYVALTLPETVQVRVWSDSNANGLQDNGELGIQGVKLRLITDSNRQNVTDQGNGGTANQELTTDVNGMVSFSKVPIGVALRVWVTSPPVGALATTKSVGTNPALNSDLNTDGTSDAFTLTGKEAGGLYTSTDLGYRMPDSVQIRVWNDANDNGLQDAGEAGIPMVWLRLIKAADNSTLPNMGNGGNCYQQVQTNADGYGTFTGVPLGIPLRVYNPFPIRGAIATNINAGTNMALSSALLSDAQTSETFILNGTSSLFNEINLGYRMPENMTVRVWDDANGNGLQDLGELGIANVKLRLIKDSDKTNIINYANGGNANLELTTGTDGTATFTFVPKGIALRVKVTSGPPGAVRTTPNVVPSVEVAAACGVSASQTYGSVNVGAVGSPQSNPIQLTEISELNNQVSFKILQTWKNGVSLDSISTYYTGSDGVVRCPIQTSVTVSTSEFTAQCGANGLATVQVFVSDGSFYGLPPVTIPALCQLTSDGKKSAFNFSLPCTCPLLDTTNCACSRDNIDSDLNDDGTSDPFDMSNFVGGIFDSIDLGYLMPRDISVRVWDDTNGNGLQDYNEFGIKNVTLTLLTAINNSQLVNQNDGGTAHLPQTTDANGYVTFGLAPKGVDLRVKVVNQPGGAAPTTLLVNTSNAGQNSDLIANGLTNSFNLNTFNGLTFGNISIGYRMPSDVAVYVWNDFNGNGIIDAGEPGISGVQLQVVTAIDNQPLVNIGGGSTCHLTVTSDSTGLVTWSQCPKALDLRVKVLNAPPGSVPTTLVPSTSSTGSVNSDLLAGGLTTSFNLLSFVGPTAFNQIALGYQMPKTVVVRVWNDTNKNGIQDTTELGINGVSVKLVLANGTAFPDLKIGGNANMTLVTDGNGRVSFTMVPMGLNITAKIVSGLPAKATVSPKHAGTNSQLDSDGNPDGTSDVFTCPSICTNLFDAVDFGYY